VSDPRNYESPLSSRYATGVGGSQANNGAPESGAVYVFEE